MSKDTGKQRHGDAENVNETLSASPRLPISAPEYEPPLLQLFTRLREAGLLIGIDEYQLVLRSLQAGFGISDKAALKRLCQTLWVKSIEERQIFEYHFEKLIGDEAVVPSSEILVKSVGKPYIEQIADYLALLGALIIVGAFISSGVWIINSFIGSNKNQSQLSNSQTNQNTAPKSTTNQTQKPQNTEGNQNLSPNKSTEQQNNQINWSVLWSGITNIDWLRTVLVLGAWICVIAFVYRVYTCVAKWQLYKQRLGNNNSFPETTPSAPASSTIPATLAQATEDEVQVAQAVLLASRRNEEILPNNFILIAEYFPITERQMKQVWRYLRRPVREGQPIELDVEATVNQIGSQGMLLKPVLLPRRVNRAEAILLIDQDGSMVPFHRLSRRLAETALRGGRLGKAGVYYFHNCPIEYLYHDLYHQEAKLFTDIVTNVCSERTAILIFSDAGAARGGYSKERYELTKEFLAKLKHRVRYIAWLNPMPRERWLGTTASEIARLVPMFEVTRPGVQDAIGMLRGRPTNFEGRRI